MITIRPSNIKAFLECPRRWLLDTKQPKFVKNEALIFGKNVHRLIERVMSESFIPITEKRMGDKEQLEKLPLDFFRNMKNDLNAANIKPTMRNFESVGLKILKNFKNRWDTYSTDSTDAERISIECTYKIQIIEKVKIVGTPDIVLIDKNNHVTILDIKTMASKHDISYYLLQLASYAFLLKKNGYETKEIGVIRVVKNSSFSVDFLTIKDATFIGFLIYYIKVLIGQIAENFLEFDKTKNGYLFNKHERHWTCNESFCSHYSDCQKFTKETR